VELKRIHPLRKKSISTPSFLIYIIITTMGHGNNSKLLFYKYLSVGILKAGGFSIPQAKFIFLLALQDYFNKKLSLPQIQEVACKMLYEFHKSPTTIWVSDPVLADALEAASDIVHYLEKINEDPYNKKIYNARLKTMKVYYSRYKNELLKN
jgi:hypothetical protein